MKSTFFFLIAGKQHACIEGLRTCNCRTSIESAQETMGMAFIDSEFQPFSMIFVVGVRNSTECRRHAAFIGFTFTRTVAVTKIKLA